MCKRKYYEAVIRAKEIVEEAINHDALTYPDQVADFIRGIVRVYDCDYTLKVAIATVLVNGTAFDNGGFNMPSTYACCEMFTTVRRRLRKKLNLYVTAYNDFDDYHRIPVWEV